MNNNYLLHTFIIIILFFIITSSITLYYTTGFKINSQNDSRLNLVENCLITKYCVKKYLHFKLSTANAMADGEYSVA